MALNHIFKTYIFAYQIKLIDGKMVFLKSEHITVLKYQWIN